MASRRITPAAPPPEPTPVPTSRTGPVPSSRTGPPKKARPTPTRKEAEAARRQRVNRTLSKKEARLEASRTARANRLRTMNARESVPERALLRDYIDARFSLGEFLLPSLVVILASSFVSMINPTITVITTIVMYVFLIAVMLDIAWMWRGFKKVLATRLPNAPTRGLLMYGMNRTIQIRRFRIPAPRVKRGEAF